MATVSASFTAVGNGGSLLVKSGDNFSYTVSNTFVGTWILQRSTDNFASFKQVARGTSTASSVLVENNDSDGVSAAYRFRCEAYTSGTMDTSLVDGSAAVRKPQEFYDPNGKVVMKLVEDGVQFPGTVEVVGAATLSSTVTRASQTILIQAGGLAKVGATAGWVVAGAADTSLVTCPASQTASTLVVPVPKLKAGDTITSFYLVGQIESAGNAVTVDADLRKQTAAAADVTDASIGAITQLSVTADTIMSSSNTAKTLATAEVVGADENFYILITATTGASTDIALMGVAVVVTEA